MPHFTQWFLEHTLLCHISRGDFQRILHGATFHAVISRTFFVVPQFTWWFPAHSLWCHFSRYDFPRTFFFMLHFTRWYPARSLCCHIPSGDSQIIICCATIHAVTSSAFFAVPHFTRWFLEHTLLRHISRGDFQRILHGATFHAVISNAFFTVPHFTRWFPTHSSRCHISCGDFQNIICCATIHVVISSAFLAVPSLTRWFPAHSFYCHLSHQSSHPLQFACFTNYFNIFAIPAPHHSCYPCFSTCLPALCLGVNFISISNCYTVTYRSLSPLFTMLLTPDITSDRCFSLQDAVWINPPFDSNNSPR